MSRIMRTIKWFREMSVLAEDEQRRSGHPQIDTDHLFLALLSIGGPVTDALAGHGVTLSSARAAFENMHARRAAQLGVRIPESTESAKRIPDFTARGGFIYRDGVRKMLEDASNQTVPDVALLIALANEPSGRIPEVLRELDVTPDNLAAVSAQSREDGSDAEQSPDYRRFLPAAPDAVWALLSNPDRWVEWNSFEFERVEVTQSGILRTYARQRRLDGKPAGVRSPFQVSEYVVSRYEPPHLIQWERSFPESGSTATQSLRIRLSPQGSGTDVIISFVHTGATRRGGFGYWLMRPLAKLLHPMIVRAHLRGKADNISRALRQ